MKARTIKKFAVILLIMAFLSASYTPLYAQSQITNYLCEIGIKFYKAGRYPEALLEFNKALMVTPGYPLALEYIQRIQQQATLPAVQKALPLEKVIQPQVYTPPVKKAKVVPRAEPPKAPVEPPPKRQIVPVEKKAVTKEEAQPVKAPLPLRLVLGEPMQDILQPIEIEQGKGIIVSGKNIQRFLLTQPNVLSVERKSADDILLTGKDIGYTYLHVWDDSGRDTLEFLTVPPRPEGPTLEEQIRLEEERASAFKLRHYIRWNSFETGKRIDEGGTFGRRYYSWYHQLTLNGATPYGDFDSTGIIRTLNKKTDLTYFTTGISEGRWGDFKGFSLRGFDFVPSFNNLALGASENIRGITLDSPAFNKKVKYTLFWGREGGGRYANLSPGLSKIKNSFLEGFDFNHYAFKNMDYGFSILHGHGRDRAPGLNRYAYDTRAHWNVAGWKMGYETAYDSQKFAHVFYSNYSLPKLNFTSQLRSINPEFVNISNVTSWRTGELGALVSLSYAPNDRLYIYNNLDVFQDRTVVGVDDFNWNEDYDFNARYSLDPTTSLRLYYTLQNEIGRLNKTRYQSPGIGLSKRFNLVIPIDAYIDYRHRENKNFSGPSADYINDNIIMGARFKVIGDLYYFVTKQFNWLEERFIGEHSRPQVLETGLDMQRQVFSSPFYNNFRITYRDEENAGAALSFLSGEDYLEGYNELSYKPAADKEIYCSARVRNVWAENPSVNKRIEADFNAGMRYTWDTGVRWEAVGDIEGYVFKDLNSDGLRQRDEPPVEGVKLWLGKNRSSSTDLFGFYGFKKIKGKKAFVTIDAASIPSGFVLTVPQAQEVTLVHGRPQRLDFGIVSRSEISGLVYYDANDDGEFNPGEAGVKNVALFLDNGMKVVTDGNGRYIFKNVSPGDYTVTLDLRSLDVSYLPKVPLTKKITLFEGVIYVYNIALKKSQ